MQTLFADTLDNTGGHRRHLSDASMAIPQFRGTWGYQPILATTDGSGLEAPILTLMAHSVCSWADRLLAEVITGLLVRKRNKAPTLVG